MVNKINNNKDLTALSGLVSFVIISGLFLSSSLVSADDSTVATASVTVPASCTMSGTGMNSHTAEIPNGTYQANIGTTTLHAFCNDANGFAIYAAGYTGNEIGGTNSNKLVGTAATDNATIVTGLATSTPTPDVSNWAMKLAIQSDSGNTTGTNAVTIDSDTEGSFASYHTVPNEYKKVAHKNTATDMTASTGGVKLTTTYAAYMSKTQPADTYTGQVIYTLVHPANHATPIAYNTNADDISEVTYLQEFAKVSDANRQSIVDSMVPEQQYTVLDARDNKTYTIARYVAGEDWTEYDLASDYINSCEEGTCDSAIYEQLSEEWQDFVDSCNGSFDNWDHDTAYSLVPPVYDVWMTKNLDLDLDFSTTYTNEDTDIGYNTSTGQYDTASWSPIRSTYAPTSTHIHEWCQGGILNSESGYCEQNNTPESYDPGNLYWNSMGGDSTAWEEYYSSCNGMPIPNCDQSKNPISNYTSATGVTQYHLGNYYNWAAAIATNDSSMFDSGGLVEQSICPAGWTLPRAGVAEDTFHSLWTQYGFGYYSYNDEDYDGVYDANEDTLWDSPLYIVAGGSFYDGMLGEVGVEGSFWNPTSFYSFDTASSGGFSFGGVVASSSSIARPRGVSVRCILRPVVASESGGGGGGPK